MSKPRKEGLRHVPHAPGHGDIIRWGADEAAVSSGGVKNDSSPAVVAAAAKMNVYNDCSTEQTTTTSTNANFPFISKNSLAQAIADAAALSPVQAVAASLGNNNNHSTEGATKLTYGNAKRSEPLEGKGNLNNNNNNNSTTATKTGSSGIAFDAVTSKRSAFIRAMTSRLAEIKDLSSSWRDTSASVGGGKGGGGGEEETDSHEEFGQLIASSSPDEMSYVRLLKRLRGSAHEWTAVDILSALFRCHGKMQVYTMAITEDESEEGVDEQEEEEDDEEEQEEAVREEGKQRRRKKIDMEKLRITPSLVSSSADLKGGFPTWNYPSYPTITWALYTFPVLESLLYSCYEDYVNVALQSLASCIEAIDPLFRFAADADAQDLEEIDEEDEDLINDGKGQDAAEVKQIMDLEENIACLKREYNHMSINDKKSNNNKTPQPQSPPPESKVTEEDESGTSIASGPKPAEIVKKIASCTRSLRTARETLRAARVLRYRSHLVATQAVKIVTVTNPLLPALASASRNPGPSAKTAANRSKKLLELHASVRHLSTAASIRKGVVVSPRAGGGDVGRK